MVCSAGFPAYQFSRVSPEQYFPAPYNRGGRSMRDLIFSESDTLSLFDMVAASANLGRHDTYPI